MAIADVTKEYVDLLSNSKYATRTSNSTEFEALKTLQSEYLNSDTNWLPDQKYNRGLALLVLHHYAMDDTSSVDSGGSDEFSGLVTTDKVGDLTQVRSLPYMSDVSGFKMYLMQTKYGTEFLYLMKTFKSSVFTT